MVGIQPMISKMELGPNALGCTPHQTLRAEWVGVTVSQYDNRLSSDEHSFYFSADLFVTCLVHWSLEALKKCFQYIPRTWWLKL